MARDKKRGAKLGKMAIRAMLLQKHGNEPDWTKIADHSDKVVSKAYEWYHDLSDKKDREAWALEYLAENYDEESYNLFKRNLEEWRFVALGHMARMLTRGCKNASVQEKTDKLIESLADVARANQKEKANKKALKTGEGIEVNSEDIQWARAQGIPIAYRPTAEDEATFDCLMNKRRCSILAGLDEVIDRDILQFNFLQFFMDNRLTQEEAVILGQLYWPLTKEVTQALAGKDAELNEAYADFTEIQKKTKVAVMTTLMNVLSKIAQGEVSTKPQRQKREFTPRRRHKSPAELTKKVKYASNHEIYGSGHKPSDIIGAAQIWVFNTYYRTLTKCDAASEAGLDIKGQTILNVNEQTSVTKKIRKPEQTLAELRGAGKIALRTFMNLITTTASAPKTRMGEDVLIVRVIKK